MRKDNPRRHLLQSMAGCAAASAWAGLGLATLAADAVAQAADGGQPKTAQAWMDAAIKLSKEDDRSATGVLKVGRFADPIYYLLDEISWQPNPGQGDFPKVVAAPKGFVTDFASIPQPFWSLLRPDGLCAWAAVIHDWLYWFQPIPREMADLAFKYAMQDFRVPAAALEAIYLAVRAGGQSAWDGNAALRRKGEKRVLKREPAAPTVRWADFKRVRGNF